MNNIDKLISGRITIKAVNTKTGEVRSASKSNTLTLLQNEFNITAPSQNLIQRLRIGLLDYPIVGGNLSLIRGRVNRVSTNRIAQNDGNLHDPLSADVYAEVTYRFASDGSTHDIYGVVLDEEASTSDTTTTAVSLIKAYAALSSVFTQGTNEVLDITYRVSANTNVLNKIDSYKLANYFYTRFKDQPSNYPANGNVSGSSAILQAYGTTAPFKINTTESGYSDFAPLGSDIFYNDTFSKNTDYLDLFNYSTPTGDRIKTLGDTLTLSKTQGIGTNLYGALGGYQSDFAIQANNMLDSFDPLVKDTTNDSLYPNYPIMPLFNNSSTSISYFEDVSNLATGLGYPTVVNNSNTDSSYFNKTTQCDNNIFKITTSGSSGNAKFEYWSERIQGSMNYLGGSLNFALRYKTNNRSCYNKASNAYPHITCTERGLVPLNNPLFQITDDLMLCCDTDVALNKQMFSIYSLTDFSYFKSIDTSSTLPIPPTNLVNINRYNSCAGFNSDEFYYTSSNSLIKVTGVIAGSPTITLIDNSTIGLTSNPIRSVNLMGKTITVFNDDGIFWTRDDGSTWNGYTMPIQTEMRRMFVNDHDDVKMACTLIVSSSETPSLMMVDITTPTYSLTSLNGYTNLNKFLTTTTVYGRGSDGEYSNLTYITKLKLWVLFARTSNSRASLILVTSDFNKHTVKHIINHSTVLATAVTTAYVFGGIVPNKLGGYSVIFKDLYSTQYINIGLMDLASESFGNHISGDNYIETAYYAGLGSNNLNNKRCDTDSYDYSGISVNHLNSVDALGTYLKEGLNSTTAYGRMNQQHVFRHTKNSVLHCYRNNGGTATLDYNADTPATNEGSSALAGARYNFETDSNDFYYCRLDLSNAVNSASYNTNGFSFCATTTPIAKSATRLDDSTGDNLREDVISSCIFELKNTNNNSSIALMYNGYDGSNINNTILIDNTDNNNIVEIVIEVTPNIAENRYSLTLSSDGSTVNVYRQGVQVGSSITLSTPMVMNGSYELSVGCRNTCSLQVSNYGSNYKGRIENICIYNNELTLANASVDAADHFGLGITANLVVRYLMTATYGEGFPCTNNTATTTPYGIDITFPDGNLSSDSYVAGDSYNCFRSKYSFIKDNATTVDFNNFYGALSNKVNTITSPINGSTTIPSTDSTITDDAIFPTSSSTKWNIKGHAFFYEANSYRPIYQTSLQNDYSLEFTVSHVYGSFAVKIGAVEDLHKNYSTFTGNRLTYGFHHDGNTIKIVNGSSVVTDLVSPFVVGDKFKIAYDHASGGITLSKWNGSAYASINTTNITPVATRVGSGLSYYNDGSGRTTSGIKDVKVTYLHPKEFMRIGDKTTSTGSYETNYGGMHYVSAYLKNFTSVKLDGTESTKSWVGNADSAGNYYNNSYMGYDSNPTTGNIKFNVYNGWIQFSTSDAGKVVTCNSIFFNKSG